MKTPTHWIRRRRARVALVLAAIAAAALSAAPRAAGHGGTASDITPPNTVSISDL